jgi:O-antigen ligase
LIDAAVTLVFLFCILMMLSRSVMLAMILCIVIVIAVDSIVRNSAFAFVGVLAAVAAALVLYVAMPPELLAALQERFFGDTGSFDARVDVYRESIPVIEQRFWIGSGIGSQGEGGSSIHNLFLSTWWNAGVLGFLASALFWTAAVLMIVRHLLRIIQGVYAQSHDLALFHAWIAVVPLTGLIRCWLIGGGVLNFSAWFALGLFFGVLYRDAMVRRARAAAPPASGLAAGSLLPR